MLLRFLLAFSLTLVCTAAERYEAFQDGLVHLRDNAAGVEAVISPQAGGELCGLKFRWQGEWIELIYRACDYSAQDGWRGKAPLLWPATGSTKGGAYELRGASYDMPQHGFIQHMHWKADIVHADKKEARAFLAVADTADTRKRYPFGWRVSVEYRLIEGRLHMQYTAGASSQNTEKMFFSIGNHITFRMPLVPGSDAGKVRMETAAKTMLLKDKNNIPTGEVKEPPFTGVVDLGNFVANPAVSLGGYAGDPSLTLTDPQGLRVRIRHHATALPTQPFVQFNLWGDVKAGYFSPEPWVGLQNSFHLKRGMVELEPGKAWNWRIEIQPMELAAQ